MKTLSRHQGGFALILTLIVASVALAIGLSLLDITIKQLTLTGSTRESEVAFQTAAAGLDCLLYLHDQNRSQLGGSNPTFGTIGVNCLGLTLSFNDVSSSNVHHYSSGNIDWDVNAKDYCVILDMYVVDARGGPQNPIINGKTRTCGGDICTYAFSRGHNLSCADIAVANIFSVQRELTAEF